MSARQQPAPAEAARAGLATGAVMTGTVAAHSWAGGALPSTPWLAAVTALVLVATRAVFRGRVSAPVTVVALGTAQFALHVALTAMAQQPTGHHAGQTMSGDAPLAVLGMDWQMAAAHAASAVLTMVIWAVTARALDGIARVPTPVHLGVEHPRRRPVAQQFDPPKSPDSWRSGAPRRGPPPAVVPQCA